jgi:hypothetical protein
MAEFSIPKVTGSASVSKLPYFLVVNVNDIATTGGVITGFPAVDAGGIKSTTNLVLAAGKKAYKIYITSETVNRADGFNEGPDSDGRGFIPSVDGYHPGDGIAINEWLQANINEKFVVVTVGCNGDLTRLHGTPCNPMAISLEETDNDSETRKHITFTQTKAGLSKSIHYVGDLPVFYADWTPPSDELGEGV